MLNILAALVKRAEELACTVGACAYKKQHAGSQQGFMSQVDRQAFDCLIQHVPVKVWKARCVVLRVQQAALQT